MDEFLDTVLTELEDIKFDVDMDLGSDSVPYQKIKTLIESIEHHQEELQQ